MGETEGGSIDAKRDMLYREETDWSKDGEKLCQREQRHSEDRQWIVETWLEEEIVGGKDSTEKRQMLRDRRSKQTVEAIIKWRQRRIITVLVKDSKETHQAETGEGDIVLRYKERS